MYWVKIAGYSRELAAGEYDHYEDGEGDRHDDDLDHDRRWKDDHRYEDDRDYDRHN
jgi:hypothetical protein